MQIEPEHVRISEQVIELMAIRPGDRILDLGCGDGWTCRRLARLAPQGLVVGLDTSEEMVHRARMASREMDNVMFLHAGAEEIPWKEGFFSHVLSVESFYSCPEPARALREAHRVLVPAGRFFMLTNLCAVDRGNVPVTALSAAQWTQLFREAGFQNIEDRRIRDDRPLPENEQGRRFVEVGALLLVGEKIEATTAARG